MEKWNFKFNPTTVDAQHVPEEFLREMMQRSPYEMPEREKTVEEREIIRDLNSASERVLSSLGLASFHVPAEFIHVVDREALRKIPELSETIEGFSEQNHIYIPRSDSPKSKDFIDHLSHEIAHTLSFSWRNVMTVPLSEKNTGVYTSAKRMGFHFWGLRDKRKGGERGGFFGVNEALTELLASRIRAVYADMRNFSKEEKRIFRLIDTYTVALVFLETLFGHFGGEQPRHMKDDYLRAYITGDLSILRQLEKQRKGAVKALAEMSPSIDDCRKAAHVLGIHDEYEENIKPFLDTIHDDGKQE